VMMKFTQASPLKPNTAPRPRSLKVSIRVQLPKWDIIGSGTDKR
jgi:hypothetical protein